MRFRAGGEFAASDNLAVFPFQMMGVNQVIAIRCDEANASRREV